MRYKSALLLIIILLSFSGLSPAAESWKMPPTPLPLDKLFAELSYVRGAARDRPETGAWPRSIAYQRRVVDYHKDSFKVESKIFTLKRPPQKIIPHAVGITEILWAICPRERLLMFNQVAADPRFSMIAEPVAETGKIFTAKESELIIAARPDLVLTVIFSDAVFKQRLKQAGIPILDLGSPDSLDSVIREIRLLGKILDESGNAEALLQVIRRNQALLRAALPRRKKPLRLLYYDLGGYIPGKSSNFTSLCKMIGAVNVGAEQGINSWRQVDHETLLKWDPDVIIVPLENNLKEQLEKDPLLSYCRALRQGRLLQIPGLYLRTNSQFMLVSADLLAGIIYPGAF